MQITNSKDSIYLFLVVFYIFSSGPRLIYSDLIDFE